MSLEREVQQGFKALEEAQAAELRAINDKLDERLQSQEEWLSKVEAQVNTARRGGVSGGDNYVRAIPHEYRPLLEMAERMGHKDAAKEVWNGLWWQSVIMAAKAPFVGGDAAKHLELRDTLEKSCNFDRRVHQKAAIGEVAGGGANVIATPVESELWRLISDNTVVRPLATKIVMTSLTHQVPVENTNVTAYIVPETSVITDSMATTAFLQRPLTAKVFAGLATVSNQLLQDNIIGLQQYVFSAVAERIGILEDQGALDGGTPAVQNFSGIAVASGVNSFGVNGTGVSGGSAPTFAELIQAIYTGAQIATRQNGAFFMLPAAFKNIASLVDTAGSPIFSFANVPNAIPQFVGGYPVYTVSSLSSAWSAATTSTNIYYGPPSKILFGDIAGMEFVIDPYSLLDKVQTRIRVLKRTGILVPVGSYFTIMRQVKYT